MNIAAIAEKAVLNYFASDDFSLLMRDALCKAMLENLCPGREVWADLFIGQLAHAYANGAGLGMRAARDHAERMFFRYLREENIQFGDADHAWDADGARAIVADDLEHWEDGR